MGRYDEISAKDLLLLLDQRAWPRAVDVRRAVWCDHRRAPQWIQALARKDSLGLSVRWENDETLYGPLRFAAAEPR